MTEVIRNRNVLKKNSADLKKQFEQVQSSETEKEEDILEEGSGTEPVAEELSAEQSETEPVTEEFSEEGNGTAPVTEELSTKENETNPVMEELPEKEKEPETVMEELLEEKEKPESVTEEKEPETDGKAENVEETAEETAEGTETDGENAETETTETTTENAAPAIFSNMIKKPGLLVALGLVLAMLVALIYSSMKKKGKKEAEEIVEKPKKETEGATEQVKEIVPSGVCPFAIGKVHEIGAREDQQDSFGASDLFDRDTYRRKGFLAVVADGMGGLSNGGAVSSLAVRTCHDAFYSMQENKSTPDMLLEMAAFCNNRVNQMLQGGQRSGSTLVSAIVRDGYLYFLTIGDSHIYLYRDGALILLNREHIYKEELSLQVINGMLPVERANYDTQAKSLTSYLGAGKITHLDRNQEGIKLLSKDRIILASDGVFGTLTPEQMEEALKLPPQEAAVKMRDMIENIGKKHQDNYTALILEYQG